MGCVQSNQSKKVNSTKAGMKTSEAKHCETAAEKKPVVTCTDVLAVEEVEEKTPVVRRRASSFSPKPEILAPSCPKCFFCKALVPESCEGAITKQGTKEGNNTTLICCSACTAKFQAEAEAQIQALQKEKAEEKKAERERQEAERAAKIKVLEAEMKSEARLAGVRIGVHLDAKSGRLVDHEGMTVERMPGQKRKNVNDATKMAANQEEKAKAARAAASRQRAKNYGNLASKAQKRVATK